jgi:streptogramin lyase
MTVDAEGRVWFANYMGHGGISVFDPATEQWKVIPGTTGNMFRSVAADDQGNIWVSNNGGALGCGLIQIDANSEIITTFHTFDPCGVPVGVGLDGKGMLWMIDYNGWTWRMDPLTLEKLQLPVAGEHYTYSDFTGSGLSGIVPG